VQEQLVFDNDIVDDLYVVEKWNPHYPEKPSEHSVIPVEYAFHLLGETSGKTILTLTSGDSADTVLSEFSPCRADHVFCIGILRQVDPIVTARKIRRVLKPGGTAVFSERLDNRALLEFRKILREADYGVIGPERSLTIDDANAVSRAVGRPGRRREFWLMTPLMHRMGFGVDSKLAAVFQKADAALLRRFSFARKLALQLVWEARKES
jgi:SAM-dependent methyltransferase